MYQGIVTIREKQWSVSIAVTTHEIIGGLSAIPAIDVNTGMLFDLTHNRDEIVINMQEMLFPLDIVFVHGSQGVVGVALNVEPKENITFTADNNLGARYFLEINAGEAEGINIGDDVMIDIPRVSAQLVTPQFWSAVLAGAIPLIVIPAVDAGAKIANTWLEEKYVGLKER